MYYAYNATLISLVFSSVFRYCTGNNTNPINLDVSNEKYK